jgi:hypothetical protein
MKIKSLAIQLVIVIIYRSINPFAGILQAPLVEKSIRDVSLKNFRLF